MSSFIEIPHLGFAGREQPSLYVNTADIITVTSTFDNGTAFEIRQPGSEACSVTRISYLPISMFLDHLGELAKWPGVRSWTDETKEAFREPAQRRLRDAADRERAGR